MGLVEVARSTYQADQESVLIREVGDQIIRLQPDVTPLLVMTTAAKRKKATRTPKFEIIEDDLRSVWAYNNGAAIDSVTTTVPVNDGTLFATYDLVAVMKADSSAAAEEVIQVTAISGNTLTVTRAIGGSGADTISQTNALRILGSAYPENAGIGAPRTTSKVVKASYTQIFRQPVVITGTMRSTETYGEQDEQYQLAKALSELKRDIETNFLFSRASESLAGPGSKRTTMGLKERISTNVTDGGTTLTTKTLDTFARSAFRYGSSQKLLIAAPVVISAINYFANNQLRLQPTDKQFGVNVNRYVTGFGTWLIAKNWQLEDGVSGQPGLDDEAYSVDVNSAEIRFLAGNGKSRDVALYRNRVQDGTDGVTHEFLGEMGIIYAQEKRFARLYDVSDYA